MDFNAFKEIVIAQCAAQGVTEYELYYQTAESVSVDTFQHSVNEFKSSMGGGVCFRAIVGGKMGYASTEDLSAEQAKALVEKAIDNASVLESEEQVFLGEGGQTYEDLPNRDYPLPTTEELIAKALETQEKIYAADPMVIDGCATTGIVERSQVAIVNSNGLDLSWHSNAAGLVVVGVVSNGTDMANDYQIKLGELSKIDTDAMIRKAVDTAKEQLGGEVAPTGVYNVVFDPEAMASLLGVFSSIFSSEAAQKGLSKLGDKEGTVIASPLVTLVDDPMHPENPDPINFDAEGSPTHKKNIIEKGELKTLLYNLKTAAVAGKKTTGNASKAGYDAPIGLRPFTMHLAAGDCTEEELLRKAGNGIYIRSVEGLHAGANAVSGDFSLQSTGYMLEDGKKTKFVKSFTVAGNFYEMLMNITAVSDKVILPNAMGKTAFGSPLVLVEQLSVAGK
jgi:PmbA protein